MRPLFRWCVVHTSRHVHVYGVSTDQTCCAGGACVERTFHCGAPNVSHQNIVLRECFCIDDVTAQNLPVPLLPVDVLRHVLAAYVGVLGCYALRGTCHALRRAIPEHKRDGAWRFQLWLEACANGNLTTLMWLHRFVTPPTHQAEVIFLVIAAALRDQVPMLRWLNTRDVCTNSLLPEPVYPMLAGAGCMNALKYLIGSCDAVYAHLHGTQLACQAAHYGRLETLRWLHASSVQRIDHKAIQQAYGRHAACVTYIALVLRKASRRNKRVTH